MSGYGSGGLPPEYREKRKIDEQNSLAEKQKDLVKELEAENKKLREALEFYACHSVLDDNFVLKNGVATQKTAREALKETKG